MISIISFGYGHAPAPEAEITVDLRRKFRNPHKDPAMRDKTARDRDVYNHVMETEGVRELVRGLVSLLMSLQFNTGDVTIAVGCGGGRHRAPAVAMAIQDELIMNGCFTEATHRDIVLPVLPDGSTH